MTSTPGPASVPPPTEAARRLPLFFFSMALVVLAALVLALPFSASAVQTSRQQEKSARQLPAPPEGSNGALPYETRPQAQVRQPERSGGPDAYGYVFQDNNNEPTATPTPAYNWQAGVNRVPDANWQRARNTPTTSALDDGVITTTLPFDFSFYGTRYRTMRIATNGNVHFGDPNDWYPDYSFLCVPTTSPYVPQGMIAPLWYDVVVPTESSGTGGVYTNVVGTSPNQTYIVEWRGVYKYGQEHITGTFEVLLQESGEIYFQYLELDQGMGGSVGVIGIQKVNTASSTIGLPYSCYAEAVVPQRAIRYRLRDATLFYPSADARGGAPGSTVIYSQTLQNQTGLTNTFALTASGLWTTTVSPQNVTLTNGSSTVVSVSVQIPLTATLYSSAVSTVFVDANLPAPGVFTATATFTTSVSSYGVAFSLPNQTRAGDYGSTINFRTMVTNTSPYSNSFDLEAQHFEWPTTVEPSEIQGLAPNASAPVTLSVMVPANSALGASDSVTLTVSGSEPKPGVYFGITAYTSTAGIWQSRSLMPISRSRGTGVLFPTNRKIYAIGGETSNGSSDLPIEEYDPVANTWTQRTTLQVGVTNIAAAAIGNAIYIPGGYNFTLGGAQQVLQVYYPLEDRSAIIGTDPLPQPRMGAGVTSYAGKLYVIGGADNSFTGTNTVYEYDPARPAGSRWQAKASMSYARTYLAAATIMNGSSGLIYAAGGMPGAPYDMAVLEAYNPANNTWSTRAPMSMGRAGLALVGVDQTAVGGCGGYLYAIGGGWQSYTETGERYDPAANRWQPISSINSPRRTLGAAYSPSTFALVAFGGWSGTYEIATEAARCSGQAPQPATPTPTVTPCAMGFSDVTVNDYFYEAVRYLYCAGVISGYEDGTFRPYNNTTRGQLTKIVSLAEGWPLINPPTPRFSDVPTNHAFYQYIETAAARNVISGYSDGTFRPGNDVTRGQLSKIVVIAEGWEIDTSGGPHFIDVAPESAFYIYVETAFNRQIITGYADGSFRPGFPATRGQISKIVFNAVTSP